MQSLRPIFRTQGGYQIGHDWTEQQLTLKVTSMVGPANVNQYDKIIIPYSPIPGVLGPLVRDHLAQSLAKEKASSFDKEKVDWHIAFIRGLVT